MIEYNRLFFVFEVSRIFLTAEAKLWHWCGCECIRGNIEYNYIIKRYIKEKKGRQAFYAPPQTKKMTTTVDCDYVWYTT